jgi:hypothetical protein
VHAPYLRPDRGRYLRQAHYEDLEGTLVRDVSLCDAIATLRCAARRELPESLETDAGDAPLDVRAIVDVSCPAGMTRG